MSSNDSRTANRTWTLRARKFPRTRFLHWERWKSRAWITIPTIPRTAAWSYTCEVDDETALWLLQWRGSDHARKRSESSRTAGVGLSRRHTREFSGNDDRSSNHADHRHSRQ